MVAWLVDQLVDPLVVLRDETLVDASVAMMVVMKAHRLVQTLDLLVD